jgi:hypothetical protein
MKKIFTFILLLVISKITWAQVPQEFNYQGVARNAQGQALANQSIKVRASLIKDYDGISLTTFYTETRTLTTNALGLFSFKIADGYASSSTGFIDDGDWLRGGYRQLLKIELDVNNSGTWTDMGTQKISSVPYAQFAKEALYAREMKTPLTSFGASSTSAQTIGINAIQKVSFETEQFNSIFDLVNDEFVTANSGMHHFDVSIYSWFGGSTAAGTVTVHIYINGVSKQSYSLDVNGKSALVSFGTNLFLNKYDKVTVYVANATNMAATVGGQSTYFNGHNLR